MTIILNTVCHAWLQYSCWEIRWTDVPRGLPSMESQKVRHDLTTKQQPLPCRPYDASLTSSCEFFLSITPQSDLWAKSLTRCGFSSGWLCSSSGLLILYSVICTHGEWLMLMTSWAVPRTLIPAMHHILSRWPYLEAGWLSAEVGRRPSPLILISCVCVVRPYTV